MVILPIRTESLIRRTPHVNYLLIGCNLLFFLVFHEPLTGKSLAAFKEDVLVFQSDQPAFFQFFTYQFLHADVGHLIGNLLFLWVFGNSVNSKMGDGPYLLFYLAGGVFAAWGYAFVHPARFQLIGASRAIAAVTTAYLAMFPRSHVTVMVWFVFFLHFFELPAMLLIGLKIIVWDNVLAPSLGGATQVAYGAHLAGYLFGFTAALGLLGIRGVSRDQFDILAVWKRWYRRQEFKAAMADPRAAARARYGSVARIGPQDPLSLAVEDRRVDQVMELRSRVAAALESEKPDEALPFHEALLKLDPLQCLGERHQLQMGRWLYSTGRFPQAAAAFERLLACYPNAPDAGNVRLLLGIIYARDLHQFEAADRCLTQSMETLRDAERKSQCREWLSLVRTALGRPVPEG